MLFRSYNSVDFQNSAYNNASTPSIQSQLINGSRYNLFKVNTRSHGSDVNNKLKVVIVAVKKAGTIAGSDYGSFSLQVRQTGLDDKGLTKDNILEQYDNLNFNPESTNYFARRIGDRFVTIDSDGKLTFNGDWDNRSKHIYVSDFTEIANGAIPKVLVPMGHAAITNPSAGGTTIPAWPFKDSQLNSNGAPDVNVLYGHDYANADASQYLSPLPNSAGAGNHTTMSLEDFNGTAEIKPSSETFSNGSEKVTLDLSHIDQRRFVVPFQGGYDGDNPEIGRAHV